MQSSVDVENTLLIDKHVLICPNEDFFENLNPDLNFQREYIINNFCGRVFLTMESIQNIEIEFDILYYACGDINNIFCLASLPNLSIIRELSINYDTNTNANTNTNTNIITLDHVPINIYGLGVYFRNLFVFDKLSDTYFDQIKSAHKFQSLTESNKQTNAFRKGIYLSNVEFDQTTNLKYNLMRCSSNFDGPTDNFTTIDHTIINQTNYIAKHFYQTHTTFNHVLAQIYDNTKTGGINHTSEKKAKIKQHSDKTKDMPRNGLIAFCTFYNKSELDKSTSYNKIGPIYNCSVLTKLRFKLKPTNKSSLIKQFDIVLYPNSIFVIDLKTNRLYTHEIIPPGLPVDKIPTRMGYVVRCSKTTALFSDNQTFIIGTDCNIPLVKPSFEQIHELKTKYYEENMTDNLITYDDLYFSLNNGDYLRPLVNSANSASISSSSVNILFLINISPNGLFFSLW